MFFKRESDLSLAIAHNSAQRSAAAARLKDNRRNAHLTKNPECAPNRKAKAKLEGRQRDYEAMTRSNTFKAPAGAFHRPGSFAA